MTDLKALWMRTSTAGRLGLVLGGLLAVAMAVALGRWALVQDYRPLFGDLGEQDAAALVAELERMKVPYRLDAGGTRILVPAETVHRTRLQLVSRNVPLHGGVGFEIFDHADFGMTEFAQKVNYQRALQGELVRTIVSLDEVRAARVHLVLPESTLFKREQGRAKASVTLALKPGRALAGEQVLGIQRLVAAAVPGIAASEVTVLDGRGATLSRGDAGVAEAVGGQLDTRRQVEEHLAGKVSAMLDRAFGAGQAIVSVDVLLDFDRVKVTTEEVLGTGEGPDGAAPSGVLVRERQSVREVAGGPRSGGDRAAAEAELTASETEYQTGRRVEQSVGTPGSVRRIHVGVVVPRGVNPERLDRIRQLVATAAGLDFERGDRIAVYSLDQMSDGTPALTPADATSSKASAGAAAAPAGVDATAAWPAAAAPAAGIDAAPAWPGAAVPAGVDAAPAWPEAPTVPDAGAGRVAARARVALPWGTPVDAWHAAAVVSLTLLAAALAWRVARRRAVAAAAPSQSPVLGDPERQALLLCIQGWLDTPSTAARKGGTA